MAKIYFHVDVNSAFLSWSALKALQDGGTVDLRTIPAVVGGDEFGESIEAMGYGVSSRMSDEAVKSHEAQ